MPSSPCPLGCVCGRHRSIPKSTETRQKIALATKGRIHSEEHRRKISTARRGSHRGQIPAGRFEDVYGYIMLSGKQDHPLSKLDGVLAEHRMVLHAKIGPGPHNCYWCRCVVVWSSVDWKSNLVVDHLDDDRTNNDPANLEPSCNLCNWNRGKVARQV